MQQRHREPSPLLGWREWVVLPDLSPVPIKAKIDTGARTSTLHAFGLAVTDRNGEPWADFEIHPIQRSKAHASPVSVPIRAFKQVRSSTGHSEKRPLIRSRIRIGHFDYEIDLTLTSRSQMGFRMLLGRAGIRRRFWVDASRSFLQSVPPMDEESAGSI